VGVAAPQQSHLTACFFGGFGFVAHLASYAPQVALLTLVFMGAGLRGVQPYSLLPPPIHPLCPPPGSPAAPIICRRLRPHTAAVGPGAWRSSAARPLNVYIYIYIFPKQLPAVGVPAVLVRGAAVAVGHAVASASPDLLPCCLLGEGYLQKHQVKLFFPN
jgi:hypothetical protein